MNQDARKRAIDNAARIVRSDTTGFVSLNDAMRDAINALPADQRATMCDKVRDAATDAPVFRVVDGMAERGAG